MTTDYAMSLGFSYESMGITEKTMTTDGSIYTGTDVMTSEADVGPAQTPISSHDMAADVLLKYLPPVFVVVGCLGNGASFLVMQRRKFRSRSTSVYLSTVAIADTVCLLHYFFAFWLSDYGLKFPYHRQTDVLCKVERFVMFFSHQWAALLIVCVSFERFLVTAFPFRAVKLCQRWVALVVVSSITVGSAVYYSLFVFVDGVSAGPCDLRPLYSRLMRWGMWVSTSLYSYIPTLALFVLNLSTASLLMASARRRKSMTGEMNETSLLNIRATKQVLAVSLTYLLLTLPAASFITLNFTKAASAGELFLLINSACNLLVRLNHAVNFFIYVLSSGTFREEFLLLCACAKRTPEPAFAGKDAHAEVDNRKTKGKREQHSIELGDIRDCQKPVDEEPGMAETSSTRDSI